MNREPLKLFSAFIGPRRLTDFPRDRRLQFPSHNTSIRRTKPGSTALARTLTTKTFFHLPRPEMAQVTPLYPTELAAAVHADRSRGNRALPDTLIR